MRLPYFDYHEPATIDEAFGLMEEHHGALRVLAGGSELLPLMKFGLENPSHVMSLGNLPNLRGISAQDGAVRIGAMTTLAALCASDEIRGAFNALHEALESVAAPPIRNVATVGGNLCQNSRCLFYNQSETWREEKPPCFKANGTACLAVPGGRKCFSVYQGDLAPAIAALAGSIRIEKNGSSRVIPIGELFTGDAKNLLALNNEERITEVLLPKAKGRVGSAYRKMRMRSAMDYPLLSVAAVVSLNDAGMINGARVVLGAVGPAPLVAERCVDLLSGRKPEAVDFNAVGEALLRGTQMVDNLELPGSYRRKMIPVFAKRAIEAAIQAAIDCAAAAGPGKETL
jgi:4-hydroxybenzoyl-CoA reductase beta subunit